MYFSKNKKNKSATLKKIEEFEESNKINNFETWNKFAENTRKHKNKLQEMIHEQKTKLIAYGASARSSTLLNFCEINNKDISFIIDKNPLKQGMLTPGSKIPIISYEQGLFEIEKVNKILLLAWNFEKEIISDLRSKNYNGKFIVPLPNTPRIK